MKNFLKNHKQILYILAITITFRYLVGLLTAPYILYQSDSYTYSTAKYFAENIFLGQVNALRTPLYPQFIYLVRLISFSPNGYMPIVVAQEIVSLISIVFMYKIITRYTENNKLIFILSLAYSLQPTIWHWNKCILTESLSISFGVMFAWLLIRHLDKPKAWSAVVLAVSSFLLVMLRPSFLSIFAIVVAFWIVRFIISQADRKQSLIGFGASLACIAVLLGYIHLNYMQNGWKSITKVATANQIMTLIAGDIYENPEYKDVVDSFTSSQYWSDRENMLFALGWVPIDREFGFDFQPEYLRSYVRETIKLHFRDYIKYTGTKFANSVKFTVPSIMSFSSPNDIDIYAFDYSAYKAWLEEMSDKWNIKIISFLTFLMMFVLFGSAYIYLAWAFIYAIVKWCRGKLDWIDLGFSLIIISQFATIIISISMDYDRLIQPALPFLFVLVYKHIAEGKFNWLKMEWAEKIFAPKLSPKG